MRSIEKELGSHYFEIETHASHFTAETIESLQHIDRINEKAIS